MMGLLFFVVFIIFVAAAGVVVVVFCLRKKAIMMYSLCFLSEVCMAVDCRALHPHSQELQNKIPYQMAFRLLNTHRSHINLRYTTH